MSMELAMSTAEIVKNFKQNPCSSQIQILADLNACKRMDIIEVLKSEGVDVGKLSHPGKTTKKGADRKKKNTSSEQLLINESEDAEIKVNLQEETITKIPVPKYYIPEQVQQMVQERIDACVRLIISHTESIDRLNREKLELEHFLKGEYKDYGSKDELFREI